MESGEGLGMRLYISYPVEGDYLLYLSSEPQWCDYPKTKIAEYSNTKHTDHEPAKVLLLPDGVGEGGDTLVDNEGIREHRNGCQPSLWIKLEDNVTQFKRGGSSQVGIIYRHIGHVIPEAGSVLWGTCNSTFLNQFHNAVNQDHSNRGKPQESKNHLDYSLLFQVKY